MKEVRTWWGGVFVLHASCMDQIAQLGIEGYPTADGKVGVVL